MKELLQIEYLKIKNYTIFRAFMLLILVLLPLIFYSLSLIKFPMYPTAKELFGVPDVWSYLTYLAGWFNVLPGILIVSLVCNEISYKTQKQNIIDGLSRMQVIMSKFYLVLLLSVIITLYVLLIGLVFGGIYSSFSNVFKEIELVGYFFIQTVGFLTLAMLLGILLRRNALGVLAFLLCFFLLGVILENTLEEAIAEWLPVNIMSDLTPFPFYDEVVTMQRMADPNAEIDMGIAMWLRGVISIIYIAGFVGLSYLITKKRDL